MSDKSGPPVLLVQFAVLLTLFGFVLTVIPAVIDTVGFFAGDKNDNRGELAVYASTPWSSTHFKEFNRLETRYYDFIGWRRSAVSAETINISEEGIRRTIPAIAGNPANTDEVFFFGGSVMWGTGSNDENTIPSQYAAGTGSSVTNYGESAWIAQQSTNMLLQLYSQGEKPERVYFLDGANEVYHKCRVENTGLSGGREQRFRSAIQAKKPLTIGYALRPVQFMMQEMKRGVSRSPNRSNLYDCDRNPEKASLIASNLITNWSVADQMARANGARLVALLQPSAYTGTPELAHIPKIENDNVMQAQFDAVYPIIKELLVDVTFEWVDLSELFDDEAATYIDFAHVTPAGNTRFVERILEMEAEIETESMMED